MVQISRARVFDAYKFRVCDTQQSTIILAVSYDRWIVVFVCVCACTNIILIGKI